MKKICETLSAAALFKGWNHDIFHDYCNRTSIRLIWKGEVLVNEGEPCTEIGLIVEGQLATQKYNSVGEFTTLELMGAGEIFGDDLIFSNIKTYSNTIEAATNAKVIFISSEVLLMMLNKSPAIMQNFLMILSDRAVSQNRRICLLSQKNLRLKITNYLLELLHDQLEKESRLPQSIRHTIATQAVELPVSKEVVSKLLAIPRPSFSRELISMARQGLIRVSGRVIWLLDLDRLEKSGIERGFQIEAI